MNVRARPLLALLTLALSACGADDVPAPDARADAPATEDAVPDAAPMDVTVDASADGAAPDAPLPDAAPPPDASLPPDVSRPPDAVSPDAVATDAAVDAPRPADAACAAGFTVAVTAPAANQEIETCTRAGMPVYFEFAAAPSASATAVEFAFRTPEGALAPPATPPDTSAPFSARRQVGGPMTAVVPLATFGIRGTWYVEVTARDACGRTATARQPFALVYTNRMCPNP
jgi:hypothetical protein